MSTVLPGGHELALLGELAQHDAVARRGDHRVAAIELRAPRAAPAATDGLRAQILQLLEADDLIGVQALAALEVAARLLGELPRLLDLRVHFGELDLGEPLALLHLLRLRCTRMDLDDARPP